MVALLVDCGRVPVSITPPKVTTNAPVSSFCASLVAPANFRPSASLRARGAGATFPDLIYQRWISLYRDAHPELRLQYDATSSLPGLDALCKYRIDFAGSDWPQITDKTTTIQFPTVGGAVVIVYNIPGLRADLRLTPDLLAGIFSGTIRRWRDSRVLNENRDAGLPDDEIHVVHRKDGSGTTRVLTEYLALRSPGIWHISPDYTITWPSGSTGMEGNGPLADAVLEQNNSIGYVEYSFAPNTGLRHAFIENNAGQFVQADNESINTAIGEASLTEDPQEIARSILREEVHNRLAYPISAVTWVLLPVRGNGGAATVLRGFFQWTMTGGAQSYVDLLGYVSLPPALLDWERREVGRIP